VAKFNAASAPNGMVTSGQKHLFDQSITGIDPKRSPILHDRHC
jgi:hypothetical protein